MPFNCLNSLDSRGARGRLTARAVVDQEVHVQVASGHLYAGLGQQLAHAAYVLALNHCGVHEEPHLRVGRRIHRANLVLAGSLGVFLQLSNLEDHLRPLRLAALVLHVVLGQG